MSYEQWLIFLPACFALNVFPGPNNLLSLTNGARFGAQAAFVAGLGRLPAFTIMIALTAVGLGALVSASESAFNILKIAGGFYLFYLGVRMLLAKTSSATFDPSLQPTSMHSLWRQDFLVASSNPKAIAIFTAFLPQFVHPDQPIWFQFFVLGVVYLVMETAAILIYAVAGAQLRTFAQSRSGLNWINRGSGGALIAAGVLLLVSQRAAA